jgi:hypothetical protein
VSFAIAWTCIRWYLQRVQNSDCTLQSKSKDLHESRNAVKSSVSAMHHRDRMTGTTKGQLPRRTSRSLTTTSTSSIRYKVYRKYRLNRSLQAASDKRKHLLPWVRHSFCYRASQVLMFHRMYACLLGRSRDRLPLKNKPVLSPHCSLIRPFRGC